MNSLLKQIIRGAGRKAISASALPGHLEHVVQPATQARFGDYQTNIALQLAKYARCAPQVLAERIVVLLSQESIFSSVSAIKPGFVNMTLSNDFLAKQLVARLYDQRLGVETVAHPKIIVVDYSSPNIAKQMHIGHLRTTVIGDAITRLLTFLGHLVIRRNHVGDWGTQFGMLIEYLLQEEVTFDQSISLDRLNDWYQQSKQQFDQSPAFAKRARKRVVLLQSGDPASRAMWERFVALSKNHFKAIYRRLGVLLEDSDWKGESAYQDLIPEVLNTLEKLDIACLDQGALVIFLAGFVDRDQKPLPMIVRKSDGSYLYASSDLAALYDRVHHLHADRLIYVADARQSQHFAMLSVAAQKADWLQKPEQLEHIAFGSVLGKDGKPFKTRSGQTIPLQDVFNEAERRALRIVQAKGTVKDAEQQCMIAHHLAMGALKYADLYNDSVRDYRFDWDKMLSFDGKTAIYLQNAYVRIRALFRKGRCAWEPLSASIGIYTDREHKLAVQILAFNVCIYEIEQQLRHLYRLSHYLYELAHTFHQFYEHCPIWSAQDSNIRDSRLQLSYLTGKTLALGMDLLGIQAVEKM